MQHGTKWPQLIKHGKSVKRINVTSGSNNKINGSTAKDVSPMYLGPIKRALFEQLGVDNAKRDDEEAVLFENYWQYGKLFATLGHLSADDRVTPKWRAFRKKGYAQKKGHRHPKGTKTTEVLYRFKRGGRECNKYKYHTACSSYYFGERMSYIESRKRVYCPMYEALVRRTAFYTKLQKEVARGVHVMILDFDGPRGRTDGDKCLEVTLKMLREKINDASAPFGHGYVFAAMLAGFESANYCAE